MTKDEFYKLVQESRKDPIFGKKNVQTEAEQWKQINMPFILDTATELNNRRDKPANDE